MVLRHVAWWIRRYYSTTRRVRRTVHPIPLPGKSVSIIHTQNEKAPSCNKSDTNFLTDLNLHLPFHCSAQTDGGQCSPIAVASCFWSPSGVERSPSLVVEKPYLLFEELSTAHLAWSQHSPFETLIGREYDLLKDSGRGMATNLSSSPAFTV